MLEAEFGREVRPQRLHAKALGRMMAGGDIGDAALAREVHLRFGDLTGEKGVDAKRNGVLEIALRAAGAPGDARDFLRRIADDGRRAPEARFDVRGQGGQRLRRAKPTVRDNILLARPALFDEAQQCAQLRVVAQFKVGVERQVIGVEADVMLEQQADAAAACAGDAPVLAFPEIAVVHQQRIGAGGDGRLDQRLAGGDPGDEAGNACAAFHLQPVWAIIVEAWNLEQRIEIAGEFVTLHHVLPSASFVQHFHQRFHQQIRSIVLRATGTAAIGITGIIVRKLWLIFSQAATISLAVLFVVATLRPEWLGRSGLPGAQPGTQVVGLKEAGNPPADKSAPARAGSFSDAVRKATPAVVNIFTAKAVKAPRHPFANDPLFRQFFGDQLEREQRSTGLGSGVIVSNKGYILTNHHVIEAADEIEVATADGKKFKARVVGSDPDTDIAVLQVTAEGLPAITFGDDNGLRAGDVVLAIGNPFGVGQTVTMGIVSAIGRSHLGINTFENFIQTDAAINPGNSGGALVDVSGNLVGINTAIYSQSGGSMGIGFAIPASSARQVMESIIETGSVTRGWIGVEAQEITPELAESFKLPAVSGALIAGVMRGGPADKAGVRPGDVLMAVNGKPVGDPQSMLTLVAALVPGKAAALKIRREAKDLEVQIEVGRRPSPQQQKRR